MRTPALNLDDAAGISKITAAHQTTHPCHQPQTLVAVFGVISFEDASELSAIAGPSLLVDSEPVIHNSGVNGTSTRPQQDGRDNSTRTTAKSRANALDSLPPPQSILLFSLALFLSMAFASFAAVLALGLAFALRALIVLCLRRNRLSYHHGLNLGCLRLYLNDVRVA